MRRSAWLFSTMLSGAIGASFLAQVSAQAQSPGVPMGSGLPAVDGFNSKVELLGGALAGDGFYGAAGSFTAPVGHSYGFQVDGLAALYNGHFAGGIGAHLFWRNPSQGLLGLYADHSTYSILGGLNVSHAAIEFERYWNRWTLEGVAGVEWGNGAVGFVQTGTSQTFNYPVGNITTFDVATRFFDAINLNHYFSDNAMLSIGHRFVGGKHALALGGEWALPHMSLGGGASLFGEGQLGEGGYRAISVGLRVHLGGKGKSLIAQHREGDPNDWMPDTLFGIFNNGSPGAPFCNTPGSTGYDPGTNECAF